jgi:hypothetical protein
LGAGLEKLLYDNYEDACFWYPKAVTVFQKTSRDGTTTGILNNAMVFSIRTLCGLKWGSGNREKKRERLTLWMDS